MTLPQPTAVAYAIANGTPTDVRHWIAVDMAEAPRDDARGYAVLVEPVQRDARSEDLANQVRQVVLQELRAHPRQPADALLQHAFGIANAVVFESGVLAGGVAPQIGLTAMVIEHHQVTVGHVPPGQFVLVQDGLVYSLPDLGSYLPHWAESTDGMPNPEPLGFAAHTAPILIRSELMPGDAIVMANGAVGRALAGKEFDPGPRRLHVQSFHAQDPDRVLDRVRDLVEDAQEPFASVVAIGFPPNPVGSDIENVGDVMRSAREQGRHARAAIGAVVPRRSKPVPESDVDDESGAEPMPAPQPRVSFQERVLRLTEGEPLDGRHGWRKPSLAHQLGAPGAHGVTRHRRVSGTSSGSALRTSMPRAPFLRSPVFIGLCLLAVFLVGMLAYQQRDLFQADEAAYVPWLASVDQRLVAVESMADDDAVRQELDAASRDLGRAREAGAPSDLVRARELQIILAEDDVNGVFRMQSVRRIGGLPDELQNGETSAFLTTGGIFLANGDLYRLDPDSAQMQLMLQQGREIDGIPVGHLFGVAYDGNFLVVTDGRAMFFAANTDGAIWQAMTMNEINQQGPWPPGPIAAFNNGMYLLEPQYRNIYLFAADPNEQSVNATDWVNPGDRVNLNIAADITIDGNVYVLLEDGQVITMFRGAEIDRFTLPNFDVENNTAMAIVSGPATGYLYIAVVDDEGTGRVYAVDRQGGHMVQLELPIEFSTGDGSVKGPFEDLQDIVVNEDTGTLYLINGDAIWSATYTLPALTEGTPQASPPATPPSGE